MKLFWVMQEIRLAELMVPLGLKIYESIISRYEKILRKYVIVCAVPQL